MSEDEYGIFLRLNKGKKIDQRGHVLLKTPQDLREKGNVLTGTGDPKSKAVGAVPSDVDIPGFRSVVRVKKV